MHFQFNFDPYRKGGATPSDVLEIWQAELDWMDANVDGGVLTVTMHPQVIGAATGWRCWRLRGSLLRKPASASSAWATSRRRSSLKDEAGGCRPREDVRMDQFRQYWKIQRPPSRSLPRMTVGFLSWRSLCTSMPQKSLLSSSM